MSNVLGWTWGGRKGKMAAMNTKWMIGVAALALASWCAAAPARAEGTAAERLAKSFEAVRSLSCEIRRDKPLPDGGTARTLSRVMWQRPGRLNSETVQPLPRRTVSDGTVFRQYIKGADKGFSRAVAELDAAMLAGLRVVPGANLELLGPLCGLPEEPLEAPADGGARFGYEAPSGTYSVLQLDAEGRWVALEVYGSRAMTDRRVLAAYSDFAEVAPGAWIACRQESQLWLEGLSSAETVRLSQVRANIELPAATFDGAAFFPGVEFVDSFDKITFRE